jgi:hypothetical protein
VERRLTEVRPGIFLADDGETLDLRASPPTWRSLDLVRVEDAPLPWQWALLGFAAATAIAWLVGGLAGGVRRWRGRPSGGERPESRSGRGWRRAMSAVATVASILVLVAVAVIAALPGVIDGGFVGGLTLPVIPRLAYHVPLAIAVAAVALVGLAVVTWTRHAWRPGSAPRYVALSAGAVLLAGQLAAWRLIGWGWS